jgi:hypothetical protein
LEDYVLTNKHVLVLGAGASQPFGFPTGIQLSKLVAQNFLEGHNAFDRLAELGFPREKIRGFRDAFFRSGKNSIDAFLEHRTDLMELGKLATAAVLIPFEREDALFGYDNNWLRYLYNRMNTSFAEYGSHQLSILTFNYDRSVEHFLLTSLQNSYGKNPDECFQVLKAIPIIHLHGTLGLLPWQAATSTREFDFNVSPQAISVAGANIKIIHEDIRDGRDKDFERAKALMKEASRILFMGFGYNPTNMDRLGLADLQERKRGGECQIYGTCVGMGDYEKSTAYAASHDVIELVPGDCLDFVKEHIHW